MCVCALSHVQLFTTPWTVASKAPLSMKISRQEYWSGLPFCTPRNLSHSGIKPTLAGRFFIGAGCCCCSVVKSCLTLQFHGLQHARLPCPLPSPGVCSNSSPLSQWSHPTISYFSSCLQSFPASGSFGYLHQVAKVLQLQLQHQSFQWIFRVHFL